jgi:ABC-type Fe3+ transport system permease subunit
MVIGISGPLSVAAVSTALSLVFGLALAWVLVNRRFPGNREIGWLASGALVLPAPIVCYALIWGGPQLTAPGTTAAAVLSAAPLVVRMGRTAFGGLDPICAQAARTLGAGDWRIFWSVELPRIYRPALLAAGLAFARVALELAVVVFLTLRAVQ